MNNGLNVVANMTDLLDSYVPPSYLVARTCEGTAVGIR